MINRERGGAYTIEGLANPGTRAKCFAHMTGDCAVGAAVLVQDDVQQILARRQHRYGLFEVLATWIASDPSGPGSGLILELMIDADFTIGPEPGKDRFTAGAVAGEVVRLDSAGGDDPVGLDRASMQAHRRAQRRPAHSDHIAVLVCIVIHHECPRENCRVDIQLLDVARSVGAICNRDGELDIGRHSGQ